MVNLEVYLEMFQPSLHYYNKTLYDHKGWRKHLQQMIRLISLSLQPLKFGFVEVCSCEWKSPNLSMFLFLLSPPQMEVCVSLDNQLPSTQSTRPTFQEKATNISLPYIYEAAICSSYLIKLVKPTHISIIYIRRAAISSSYLSNI